MNASFTTIAEGERRRWKSRAEPAKGGAMQSAGSFLAAAIIAGAVGGVIVGQPSIGFLVGTAAGIVVVTLYWLRDRKRQR